LDQLFWLNGREVIPGELGRDGQAFEFDTRVQVDALEPKPGYPGCTLSRQDRASGRLGYEDDEVDSFSGRLTFSYLAVGESDCSPLMGVEGGFHTLPCEMSYHLEGTRSPEN
jgi:hypothetical protein